MFAQRSATWRIPRVGGGGAAIPPTIPASLLSGFRLRGLVRGRQLSLDRLEVGANLGIAIPLTFDLPHCAHHRRVVAVAESSTQLGKAALEPRLAEVHRHVSGERHALVTILGKKI